MRPLPWRIRSESSRSIEVGADRSLLTFNGVEEIFGSFLKCDEDILFHVETDLFNDGMSCTANITEDDLADEKQSVVEDVEFRSLLGCGNVCLHQRMDVVAIADVGDNAVLMHAIHIDP